MADDKEDEKNEADGAEEEDEAEDESEDDEGEDGDDDEDGDDGDDGDGKKKKKKKKGKISKLKLIIFAVVLVAVIAVPSVLYIMGVFGSKEVVSEHVEGEGKVTVGEDGELVQSIYYDMEEFIVNLNVGSKRPSFLKMTVSLELPGEMQIPRIEEKMPRIRDGFQIYLRELRQEDLQGSAGLYRLREELLLRINKIVYPAKVSDILFKEILVQ